MNNEYPEDWVLALKYAAALEFDEAEMRRVFNELGLSIADMPDSSMDERLPK